MDSTEEGGRLSSQNSDHFRFIPCGLSCPGCTYRCWCAWLDTFNWDTFATLTFSDDRGREVTRVGDRITEWLWRATGSRSVAFTCAEHGRKTGRFHCHALVTHGEGGRDLLNKAWRLRYGFASVRRYDPGRGAAKYVGKYTLKEAYDTGTYHFSGHGPGLEAWHDLQVRTHLDCYGEENLEVAACSVGAEETFYLHRKRQALRREKAQISPELMRIHSENWWIDMPPMSGYTRYLAELTGFCQESSGNSP